VVGMQQADPEHFAISHGGVTHIRPGQDTEVTPLHEWTREKQLFNTVCRLPFFGKHTLAKAFWHWIIGIRVKRYSALRRRLNEELLAANELFGPSLRRVAHTLAELNMNSSRAWRRDAATGKWCMAEEEEAPVILTYPHCQISCSHTYHPRTSLNHIFLTVSNDLTLVTRPCCACSRRVMNIWVRWTPCHLRASWV
jgi:hypothetical protein